MSMNNPGESFRREQNRQGRGALPVLFSRQSRNKERGRVLQDRLPGPPFVVDLRCRPALDKGRRCFFIGMRTFRVYHAAFFFQDQKRCLQGDCTSMPGLPSARLDITFTFLLSNDWRRDPKTFFAIF